MNLSEQRQIAIRAARSQLRRMGCLDNEMTLKDAELVLDEMARSEPDLVAAQWFRVASNTQWNLFKKEWKNATN